MNRPIKEDKCLAEAVQLKVPEFDSEEVEILIATEKARMYMNPSSKNSSDSNNSSRKSIEDSLKNSSNKKYLQEYPNLRRLSNESRWKSGGRLRFKIDYVIRNI